MVLPWHCAFEIEKDVCVLLYTSYRLCPVCVYTAGSIQDVATGYLSEPAQGFICLVFRANAPVGQWLTLVLCFI